MQIPAKFTPVTFEALLQHFVETMPLLAPTLYDHLKLTPVVAFLQIGELERKGLAQFAIAPDNEPAVFIAPNGYHTEAEHAFAKKLVSYWDTTGQFDAISGKIVGVDTPVLPPHAQPFWLDGLEQKVRAIKGLTVSMTHAAPEVYPDVVSEIASLRMAEVYAFSDEMRQAICAGAQSIPHDAALSTVEYPLHPAGWYWFEHAFPVGSESLLSNTTAALLWSWGTHEDTPTLMFTAYVRDAHDPTIPVLPGVRWGWSLDMSLHQLLAETIRKYRKVYGEGTDRPKYVGTEHETVRIVAELSLFFLMTCVWFRQTVPGQPKKKVEPILTQTLAHVERHERKRVVKQQINATVRVIALRKTATTAEPVEPGQESERHLTVRFIVSGHPRLQPCGPGRKDHKLIWIAPYPKGPEDAPFKESAPKVFAVVR